MAIRGRGGRGVDFLFFWESSRQGMLFGIIIRLPTFPSPKPPLTPTFHLGQKYWLRGGVGGQFPGHVQRSTLCLSDSDSLEERYVLLQFDSGTASILPIIPYYSRSG